MYQCELYSIKKSSGSASLRGSEDALRVVLEREGIELRQLAELPASPSKISSAVGIELNSGAADMFIFMNALDSTDHSSFRKLFYELISSLEGSVVSEDKTLTPKLKVSSVGDLGNGYRGCCFSLRGKRFLALPAAELCGKENDELLREALRRANNIFERHRENYPEGVAFVDKNGKEVDSVHNRTAVTEPVQQKQKQGFFRSFIPMKGDSKKQKIRKIVVLIAIVAFIGALIYVLDFYIFGPMQNNSVTSEIQSVAYSKSDTEDADPDAPSQDWDALKKINDEIVGWITIPDTVIDYPVLEHKGDDRYNQYYIKRTYKKDYSEYGSIFLDYRCTDGTRSRNVIMHGHDMLDGSMFAGLLKYSPKGDLKGNLDYYREHPIVIFNTPDGDAKYKIISLFKTSTRYEHGEFFNYMQGDFNSDAEFMNFVYNMRIRSMFDIPVTVNEDDQIITLSTCCYEFYEWRCVLVARKVRPGEDENVDVQLATLNSSPLFPDVYYERYGGERPDPGTFKTANAKGKVSWYDGKGNLEGSEDLTATLAANPTEPPTEKPKPGQKPATEPPEITYYQVIFRNYDGSQFDAYNVKEGDPVPIPNGTPTMPDDEYYTYKFSGWNMDVDGVDFQHLNVGLDIYPSFDAIPK